MDAPRTKIPDDLEEQREVKDENIVDKPWDLKEEEWHSWVRIYFLVFGALTFSLVMMVFFWHLLTPFHWLAPAGLDKINNFALSIIVGLLTSYITAYFFSKRR